MIRSSRRRTATAVLFSLPLLAPAARVCNANEPAERTYAIHIDSQPLSTALGLFCEQTGLKLWSISAPASAEKIMVPAVDGHYTREEGFRKLAGQTGVEFTIKGGLYLVPRIPASRPPAETSLAPVELVEANVPVPEVLVQGSRSSNVAILAGEAGPTPLKVYKADELERSGYRTAGAFLRGMLTANVLTSLPTGASKISAVGQPINLFGVAVSDTVVTVDGHLLAGLAMGGLAQQTDLESIDLATVERIEVMQGTATALGGGGGIAGRVNIVTRSSFAGTLVNVRSAQLPHIGSSSRDVSLATGFGSREDLASVSLKASWSIQDAIRASQNNSISPGSARVAENNPDRVFSTYPPLGADPNTRLLTGGPLGEYSYRLAPTAQEMGGGLATFRPGHDVKSVEVAIGHDFLSGLSLDFSAGGAKSIRNGLVSVIEEKFARTRLLPPNSPGNSLSVPVLRTAPDNRGDGEMTAEQDTRFAHVALKSSLFGVGMIRLGYSYSTLSATLQRPTLTDDLILDMAKTRPYASSAKETTILAMMPVFGRAKGTGYLTFSASYRVEDLADASAIGTAAEVNSPSTPVPHGSQIDTSMQGQLALPLLWGSRADPLLQSEISIRGDKYRIATDQMAALGREPVSFNKTTGQLSVGFKPFAWWEFRAGASTGFRPAPLTQLSPSVEQQIASLPVPDLLRGGELLGPVKLRYGGSFELRPETARTYKVGFVFTPILDDELRLSADYLWIKKRDVILGPDDLLFANPVAYLSQFSWRVTRESTPDGSPGRIVAIDSTSINISQLDVKALDLGLNWRTHAGSLGTFELVTNATVAPSFVRKLTPDSAAVDEAGIGTLSAPRYRLSSMAVLTGGPLEIGLTGRLTSKTRVSLDQSVIADQGGRSIGRQGYLDLFVGYTTNVPSLGNAKLRIRFDANNVLRRKAEFNAAAPRYIDRFGEDELPSLALSFSVQSGS